MSNNIDPKTVVGFGREWSTFDQPEMPEHELTRWFEVYFALFPWDEMPVGAQGIDIGCGSGRWAALVAPRVGHLHCVDPSADALKVAKQNLSGHDNVTFHCAGVDGLPMPDASFDFVFSLGVLHHVPDTAAAIASAIRKLKPGAPFLVYLYYRFDNRPGWFQALWWASDWARRAISGMPFAIRRRFADAIAFTVYWPLSRLARLAEGFGRDVATWPLSAYRDQSLYTLRTDALDRFGTRLEQRFTRAEIAGMLTAAGGVDVRFWDDVPY